MAIPVGSFSVSNDSIIAANSLQIATEPLPDELRSRILPHGEVLSDTRKVIRYWRLDDQGRLLLGGRGPYREPEAESDWQHLVRDLKTMFPALAHLRITHRWAGRIAIHPDFMPHLHEPELRTPDFYRLPGTRHRIADGDGNGIGKTRA